MKKLLSTASAIGFFASTSLINSAYADVSANTLPVFNNGTNVGVTTTGNNMNIKITDENQFAVGTANWHTFNIGKDAKVNVEFSAHNQTSLNYVDAAGGMSQIYGKFTDSGCYGCGYEGTGKVILINPNGILFGNGANVDLNSFTGSTMNGTYDKNSRTLKLTKTGNKNDGIVVQDGAKIYGDKNVSFASENINIYKGSQISTNTTDLNVDSNGDRVKETALGKVKLITGDGVNFKYYNNAAIEKVEDLKASTDKMTLWIGGNITSGHIHAENASTDVNSEVNANGAVLKAYKAEKGSDGNIWLKSNNRVITEKTEMNTYNSSTAAAGRNGGNVRIESNNKSTLNNDTINAVGNVDVITHSANNLAYTDHYGVARTNDGNVNADNSTITAKNINLDAYNIASIQNGSTVKGSDVTVKGQNRGQIVSSSVTSDNDINVKSGTGLAWVANSNLNAGNDVNIESTNGGALLQNEGNAKIVATRDINVKSYGDVTSRGTNLDAGQDINIESTNSNVILQNGTKTAVRNINITANNTVSTDGSALTAGEDLNVTAKNGGAILKNTTAKATNGNVNVISLNDIIADNLANSTFTAGKDVNITSTGNSIKLNDLEQFKPSGELNLKAAKDVQIAKDGELTVKSVNIDAGKDITLASNNSTLTVDSTTKFVNAENIYLKGGQDVLTSGTLDVNSLKTDINAARNVNVTLTNVDNVEKGLVAVAGNDMTVSTPGTLSVSYLKSGNDMTINADRVKKGKAYMDDPRLSPSVSTDADDRSYIEVGGENFTSNVTNDNYVVTASDDRTNDNKYNQRHHIQYGDEKIYLVHKLPVPDDATDPDIDDPNNGKEKGVIEPGGTYDTTPIDTGDTTDTTPIDTGDTTDTTPIDTGDTIDTTPIDTGDTTDTTDTTPIDTTDTTPADTSCDSPFASDDIQDEEIE